MSKNKKTIRDLNDSKNKISIAPNYFLLHEYFDTMEGAFKRWRGKEVRSIEKKYGKHCMKRIDKGEIPINKKAELRTLKGKKGKDLDKWKKEEMKCFLAFVNLNDLAEHTETFYYSFLIFVFAYFENILNNICYEYEQKYTHRVKLKDFAGKGIVRAKKYMEKICGFVLPGEMLEKEILLIRDIRNCLAHSSGEIKDINLLKHIKKHKLLDVHENFDKKTVYFDDRYCKFAIKKIEEFLNFLVKRNDKYLWHW